MYILHAFFFSIFFLEWVCYESGNLNQVNLSSLEYTAVHSTPLTSTLMCLHKDKCFISAGSHTHSSGSVLKHVGDVFICDICSV